MPGAPINYSGPSITSQVMANRTEENLDERDKYFRDAFVKEYIYDFNGPAALIRTGHTGNIATARTKSCNLLREPYVANRIKALVRELKPEDVVTRQQVMAAMWMEANNDKNQGKVRVAALAHIATMLGMTKPKEDTGNQPSGVLLVPMMPEDDWSLLAAASQKTLKSAGAIDVEATVVTG